MSGDLDPTVSRVLSILSRQSEQKVPSNTVLRNYLLRMQQWLEGDLREDAKESEKRMHKGTKQLVTTLLQAIDAGKVNAQDVFFKQLAVLVTNTVTVRLAKSSFASVEDESQKWKEELEKVKQELEELKREKSPEVMKIEEEDKDRDLEELENQLAIKNLALLQQSAVLARGGLPAGLGTALMVEKEELKSRVNRFIALGRSGPPREDEVWPDLNSNRRLALFRDAVFEIVENYRVSRYIDSSTITRQGLAPGFAVAFGIFWQRFALPFHALFFRGGVTELLQELTGLPDKTKSPSIAQNPAVYNIVADGERYIDKQEPFPGPYYGDLSVTNQDVSEVMESTPEPEITKELRELTRMRKEDRGARYTDALWPGYRLLSSSTSEDNEVSGNELVQNQPPDSSIFQTPPNAEELTPEISSFLLYLRNNQIEPGLAEIDENTVGGGGEQQQKKKKNMSVRVLLLTALDAVLQMELTGYTLPHVDKRNQPQMLIPIQAQSVNPPILALMYTSPWKAHSYCGGAHAIHQSGRMTLAAQGVDALGDIASSAQWFIVSPDKLYPQNYFAATYLRAWIESFTNQPVPASRSFYEQLFGTGTSIMARHPVASQYPYAITGLLGYHDDAFSMIRTSYNLDMHSKGPPPYNISAIATTFGSGPNANRLFDLDSNENLEESENTPFVVVATSPYALGSTEPNQTMLPNQAEVANQAGMLFAQQHASGIFHNIRTPSLTTTTTSTVQEQEQPGESQSQVQPSEANVVLVETTPTENSTTSITTPSTNNPEEEDDDVFLDLEIENFSEQDMKDLLQETQDLLLEDPTHSSSPVVVTVEEEVDDDDLLSVVNNW